MDQTSPPPARWTPARQRIFLASLLETGSIARAANAAGMSRSSAHRLRAKLKGTTFDRMWGHAIAEYDRRLADPLASDQPPSTSQPIRSASPANAGAQSRPAS